MGTMKLYRLLQAHVGETNTLVVALYREEITPEEAQKAAIQQLEQALAELTAAV